jgi:hypothetical protein
MPTFKQITFGPGIAWDHVWHNGTDVDFSASRAAERFLKRAGFSVGREQRGAPRGILFGDYNIQKWRNLTEANRDALHGIMTGDMRSGPVSIIIFSIAPEQAKIALASAFDIHERD